MSEIKPCPEDELVERLDRLIDVRRDFVSKRTAMNASIPAIDATPAERAVYDERYKADREAERALTREALCFAIWAAEANPLAVHRFGACASVQKERDELRDFMEEAKRLLGQISKSDWASIEEMKGIGIELGPESTAFAREIDAFLARYEGGRK